MKRGKRQVVELEPEPLRSQQNSTPFTNQYFSNSPSILLSTMSSQNYQTQSQTIQTSKTAETSVLQTKPLGDDADEKKRKIELLKQKYLKKSKPEDPKAQSAIQQPELHGSSIQVNVQQKASTSKVIKQEQVGNFEPQQVIHQPKRQLQNIQEHSINVQTKIEPKRQLFMHENSSHLNQQKINKQPEQKISQVLIHQEVPKPPTKIQGRNPPPPPPMKKNISPPVVHQVENFEPGQQKLQTKTVPQKQQLKEEAIDLVQRSQRSDNSSFAPPSLSTTNQGSKQEKKGGPMIPPPPPNRNMKEILTKKLSSQKTVPKPPTKGQTIPPGNHYDDETASNPSFQQSQVQNSKANQRTLATKQIYNHQIDDEYNQTDFQPVTSQRNAPANKTSFQNQGDPSRLINEWLGSPEITLKELFPQLKQAIEFYCLHKNLSLKISSNNPGFTPLIAEFIQTFVINNTIKYTDDQKRVAESICLTFFYSSATEFSDIFLVLLLKIGEEYLQKYQKALEDKLEMYLSRILFFKNLFLSEELNSFIAICMERNWVREDNFVQFLMLSDSGQLLGLIQNTEMIELRNKLGVLCFCRLNFKSKNLLGLYLKLISSIEVQLTRNGLIQKILNHLKELDIPENLYQYTKQLKLKLLKNYENNSQSDPQSFGGRIQQNTQSSVSNNNETSKDSGLFGYFNLNKAIDKIKTSTQKALGAVQKPKKPQQEEKKDQIVYDPIRKRYIINGEIPEDQNQSQHQQTGSSEVKAKVPPPPPLGAGRKAPPPMHNKKPGPRITGNRYA